MHKPNQLTKKHQCVVHRPHQQSSALTMKLAHLNTSAEVFVLYIL